MQYNDGHKTYPQGEASSTVQCTPSKTGYTLKTMWRFFLVHTVALESSDDSV